MCRLMAGGIIGEGTSVQKGMPGTFLGVDEFDQHVLKCLVPMFVKSVCLHKSMDMTHVISTHAFHVKYYPIVSYSHF